MVNLEGCDGVFVWEFLIENVLMWLCDYGFDGLCFDVVYVLKDVFEWYFFVEFVEMVWYELLGWCVYLMFENEVNQVSLLVC